MLAPYFSSSCTVCRCPFCAAPINALLPYCQGAGPELRVRVRIRAAVRIRGQQQVRVRIRVAVRIRSASGLVVRLVPEIGLGVRIRSRVSVELGLEHHCPPTSPYLALRCWRRTSAAPAQFAGARSVPRRLTRCCRTAKVQGQSYG
jgi:hypothetical protein